MGEFRGLVNALLASCVLSVLLGRQVVGGPPDRLELLEAAIARYDAIFSGRFAFKVTNGFTPTKKIARQVIFLRNGDSWKVLSPSTGSCRLSHAGKFVKFVKTKNATAANVVIDFAKEHDRSTSTSPLHCGTFWYPETVAFIRKNANKSVERSAEQVAGIMCRVIDVPVPATEGGPNAFYALDDTLTKGGIVRLYVAPELGHALPRCEFLDTKGVVQHRFEASDFVEVANGIFFPKRCESRWTYAPDLFVTYDIESIEDVNEPIPDSEFVLFLPSGSRVQDIRGPKNTVIFTVDEFAPIPSDLANVIQTAASAPTGWRAIAIGIIAGLVLAAVVLFLLRTYRVRK